MSLFVKHPSRAIPELDRFSDEAALAIYKRVCQKRWWDVTLVIIGALVLAGIVGFLMLIVVGELVLPIAATLLSSDDWWVRVVGFITGTTGISAAVIIIGISYSGLRVGGIRAMVCEELVSYRQELFACPVCDYSLVGLPHGVSIVRCPECGTAHDLVIPSVLTELGIKSPPDSAVTTDRASQATQTSS